MKKKKIIFDFQDFSGGASRSQLSQAKLAKKLGYKVVATIGHKSDLKLLEKEGIECKLVKNFRTLNPLNVIINIISRVKLYNNLKPDLIFSNRPTQYKYLSVVSDITGIPMLVAQAGGIARYHNIKSIMGKKAIVYSKENRDTFKKEKFPESNIFIIPNRIELKSRSKYSDNIDKVIITLTGNISFKTYNGINYILEYFEKHGNDIENKFLLRFAGADRSKEDKYISLLNEKANKINNTLSDKGEIKFLGWVSEIINLQSKSHICIGKGRSILTAVLLGKVSYVISEKGMVTRVTPKSYKNLSYYNFSGRGPQTNNADELLKSINNKSVFNKHKIDAKNTVSLTSKDYLISNGEDKFNSALKSAISNKKTYDKIAFRYCRGIARLISIYLYIFVSYLTDKNESYS